MFRWGTPRGNSVTQRSDKYHWRSYKEKLPRVVLSIKCSRTFSKFRLYELLSRPTAPRAETKQCPRTFNRVLFTSFVASKARSPGEMFKRDRIVKVSISVERVHLASRKIPFSFVRLSTSHLVSPLNATRAYKATVTMENIKPPG